LLSKKLPEVYGDKQRIELEATQKEPIAVLPRIGCTFLNEDDLDDPVDQEYDDLPPRQYNKNGNPIIPLKKADGSWHDNTEPYRLDPKPKYEDDSTDSTNDQS